MKKAQQFKSGGKNFLGFDTGLDAQAFAQAKAAQFLTQQGCIVYPDGNMEPWIASGVEENADGKMVICGPDFQGESLLRLLGDEARKEEALDAVRFWINARLCLEKEKKNASIFQGAAGSFVVLSQSAGYPHGTVLFAPERIVKRSLEASGDDEVESAQQWSHPDLSGEESASFSAAAMLYSVFCGEPPFRVREDANINEKKRNADGQSVIETLRQDIREGVFMPPELAAPGMDNDLCTLLNETLSETLSAKKQRYGNKPVSLETFSACMHRNGKISSWFSPLGEEENQKIIHEREQYRKSRDLQVKTRRFVLRNTAMLAACAAAFIAVVLGINGFIKQQASKPTTKGMSPVEVVETYYGAFGPMDHILMEACVINKAGKGDINMVTNVYVITKMRGAYEANLFNSITAQEWVDAGSPETGINIFGVTDLKIRVLGGTASSGEINFEADYRLWMPASFLPGDEDVQPVSLEELAEGRISVPPPVALVMRDRLKLVLHRNAWRISEIARTGL